MKISSVMLDLSKQLTLFFILLIWFPSYSQSHIKGKITDAETKLPIAFASVIFEKNQQQSGTVSDVFGLFEITEQDIQNITVSCVGYKTTKFTLSAQEKAHEISIRLEPYIRELGEVIVTTKNNPAIRIIKNALSNKKQNDFENYPDYSYRCYLKTIIDYKLAEESTSEDSIRLKRNKMLKSTTPFISEAVLATLKRNKQLETKITAIKTAGFKDPLLPQTFVSLFHQAVSFYRNSVSLFQIPIDDKSTVEYVSPLSDGCLSAYTYELENNYVNNLDTTFIINFQPKKGPHFNGLKGTLFICSNGFAIKNIVVEPADKPLVRFRFRQDYEFIGNKWFPTKLEEEIGWMMAKKSNIYPSYIISSYIDSINVQASTSKDRINLEKVYLDANSIKKSDEILAKSRPDTLTKRETNSYHFMDSVGKKYHLDSWMALIPSLADGKIPYKKIDIHLNDIYTENKFEGARLGIGLSTNEHLFKNISLGGFIGYGIKDKKLKYSNNITFDINRYREIQLKLSYQNTLSEIGTDQENTTEVLTFSDYLRGYMASRFDHLICKRVDIGIKPFRNFSLKTALSFNKMSPLYAYTYQGNDLSNFTADAFELSAKYAFGEELQTINSKRYTNFEGNPIIEVNYKRGIDLFNKNSFTYNCIQTNIDYTVYNGRIGQSKFHLSSGYINKSLPYSLLFTGEGSKSSNFSFIINNSFQTMTPYEFLSDKYLHLFYSHNFGTLLLNTRIFKPQFIIVHNTGWGTIKNPVYQGIDFNTMEKIYLESGLIVNNVLKLKYMNMFYVNLGIGGFYRYGKYGFSTFNDNLALRLSLTVSLK